MSLLVSAPAPHSATVPSDVSAPTRGAPSSGVSPPPAPDSPIAADSAVAADSAAPPASRTLRIAVLGCGTVGSGFLRGIERDAPTLLARHALRLLVVAVLVRDPDRVRDVPAADRVPYATSLDALLAAEPDVVVDALPGGPAASRITASCLARGIDVVTANKAVLAEDGEQLLRVARASGARLLHEASVAAGIPFFGVLRNALRTARITGVTGVLNATGNVVATRVAAGDDVAAALRSARQRGLAEPDAADDLSGADAARKLRVLHLALTGRGLPADAVHVRGIADLTPEDARVAAALGFVLRPVASLDLSDAGVRAWTAPAAVPAAHPLAQVADAENGVLLHGPAGGPLFLRGPGAGPEATAAALLDDVVAVAECARSSGTERPRRDERRATESAGAAIASPGATSNGTSDATSNGPARRGSTAPGALRFLVVLSPAPSGPKLAEVLRFLATEGVCFEDLRTLPPPEPGSGRAGVADPVATLAGVTSRAPGDRVERLLTNLRTVGAVLRTRAFPVLD